MVTILLEKILTLLTGWLNAFTEHATNVLSKLNLIEEDTSNLPDIKTNTDSIVSNTASVITPINNIKSNTDSIKTNTDSIKNDTTVIKNNINTISTNVGTASAFCEDTANNTLEIVDKITTIASDTTQLRTNSNSISSDVSEIKNTLGLYLYNTIVTEDSEGVIANFDTDLEDYLQALKVTIPADPTGYTGINLKKIGKNICPVFTADNTNGLTTTVSADGTIHVSGTATGSGGYITTAVNFPFTIPAGSKITLSISNVLTGNLRMLFNSGTADISVNNKSTTLTASVNLTSGRLYLFTTANQAYDLTFKFQIEIGTTATTIEEYKADSYSVSFGSSITDGAEADLINGLVKVNTTPESFISITPLIVRTYKGVNNILSDVGSTALTYRETLKKYLEKHNQ